MKAARQLVGLWPHAKPPDPETYAAGIAATLAGYPLGIVQECCDPRTGLARSREFPPTVAAIVEWCDVRLAFYRSLAAHNGRLMLVSERRQPEFSEEHCAQMRERIAAIPRVHFRSMEASSS